MNIPLCRCSSVGIVTSLPTGQSSSRIPAGARGIPFLPNVQILFGPPSLLFNGYQTLCMAVNECPSFLHLFFDLYGNRYEVFTHNAVDELYILWKSSQRRLYFSYIRAKGITFGLLYTLKIKNAFVLLCALSRNASTPFPVLFLRLFVQSVLLTSGQGAKLANGSVGIFVLCVNW